MAGAPLTWRLILYHRACGPSFLLSSVTQYMLSYSRLATQSRRAKAGLAIHDATRRIAWSSQIDRCNIEQSNPHDTSCPSHDRLGVLSECFTTFSSPVQKCLGDNSELASTEKYLWCHSNNIRRYSNTDFTVKTDARKPQIFDDVRRYSMCFTTKPSCHEPYMTAHHSETGTSIRYHAGRMRWHAETFLQYLI